MTQLKRGLIKILIKVTIGERLNNSKVHADRGDSGDEQVARLWARAPTPRGGQRAAPRVVGRHPFSLQPYDLSGEPISE